MRFLFIAIACLFASASSGQIQIYPVGLTDSTKSYLYIGIDNPIRISESSNEHMVSISGGGGTLTRVDKGRYIVRVSSVTDDCRISVSKQGPGKILAKREFMVRTIGIPETNWRSGRVIARDTLLKTPFLAISIPECYFKLDFRIVSYEADLDSAEAILHYPVTGAQFSPELIQQIKLAKPGSILTLDNIRVLGPGGRSFKSPGIVLYLDK